MYRGPDAIEKFMDVVLQKGEQLYDRMKFNLPMVITPEQEESFLKATHCHICNLELHADRVRDHDHVTGLYRGPAHNKCNVNYNFNIRRCQSYSII